MDGKGCTDPPAVMIAATAPDKTTMALEVGNVLLGIELFAGARRGLGQFGAAVCIGDSAYLSTVQLKRIFATKALRNDTGRRAGVSQRFSSPYPNHATLLL
jgi:hypothetical protein